MNERIQQFAEQARTSVPAGLDTVEWIAKYNERFAELLEKEFFSAGYLAGKSDGTMETIQECADFLRDTLDDHFASEQLREHFGVDQ